MVGHSAHPLLFIGIVVLSGAMLFHGPPSTPSHSVDELSPGTTVDGAVPVSSGTSITIWEQTTGIYEHVFQVSEVLGVGLSFYTPAELFEIYTVSSDGTTLSIYCYKVPPEPMSGMGTGNNIVAVRLDGVPEHPEGLYASVIVSYVVGVGGVDESRWNALGSESQVGPYMGLPYTSMGDYGSEVVLAFTAAESEPVDATVDFDPDVLNSKSSGKWVTCYIELPSGYGPADIDICSVLLNGEVPADASHAAAFGDHDCDGLPDLMLKFDRDSVRELLSPGESVQIEVTGSLSDGTPFSGTDFIRVLDK